MPADPVWLMQPIPYLGEKIRGEWIYEPKIDGWRMQILHNQNGRIECWGRRLERKPNWSGKLIQIVSSARPLIPKGTLLDCELYSSRGRRFVPSLFCKKPKVKPIVYVFDVIMFKNRNVNKMPLYKRKELLKRLKLKPPFIFLPGKKLTDLKKNYKEEINKGHEGIVIKKLNSPYLIGKEAPIATQYWRKIK